FHGRRCPVATLSEVHQVDVLLQPAARIDVPADYPERAIYVVQGALVLGSDGVFEAGWLLVIKPGKQVVLRGAGPGPTRLLLVGGRSMDGPRYITLSFVSSSPELIEQAQDDWRDQKFPGDPEDTESIPLPAI